MRKDNAILPTLIVALIAVVVIALGVVMSDGGAEGAVQGQLNPEAPVTTPIESPHATVAPPVAREMNGKMHKVRLASGIKMHAPKHGLKGLAGNGQGNGCLRNYGRPGQCLPIVSPAQQAMPDMDMPWTCAQVRQLFRKGIVVRGRDTLGLDTNGDGRACGRGDG